MDKLPDYVKNMPWVDYYADETIPMDPLLTMRAKGVSLYEMFRRSCEDFSERDALIFITRKITYGELGEYVERFASALHFLGIEKGDRVALLMPNSPQFVISYYAILAVGGVVVPLSPLLTPSEIEFELNDSGASAIIAMDVLFVERVLPIRDKVNLKFEVVTNIGDMLQGPIRSLGKIIGRIPSVRVPSAPNRYGFMDLLNIDVLAGGPVKLPEVEINPKEDVAVLQYTGGTTGTPKGAMLTHFNIVSQCRQLEEWLRSSFMRGAKMVTAAIIPWFHIYGQTTGMNLPLLGGATIVILPAPETKEVLNAIEKYKVNVFPGVPLIFLNMVEHPDVEKYDLSSLRFVTSGAFALPLEVAKKFESITGVPILEGYGLTETCPVTHVNIPPPRGLRKLGSIGVPLPGTLAAIADPDEDRLLPAGEVGELVVAGPQVMKGYWNRPKENRNAFFTFNGIRWLRTGDIAKMDEDGYFYIVDRKKDMIKYKGYQVFPREVEEVLYQHPGVLEAVVVGVPDPRVGEMVKAYVVLRPEYKEKYTEKDIIEWCRKRLAAHKYPRIVEFRDTIPKTYVGKAWRRLLAEEEKRKMEGKPVEDIYRQEEERYKGFVGELWKKTLDEAAGKL
ncbi:MAG: long-chain-fatty-acid--CoA ligase [Candidatus Freyarchaeota archaeon]|nr:long-chain fatty acid--CoA ligase [Candidatus Freyrarchaeum guaymaensis]